MQKDYMRELIEVIVLPRLWAGDQGSCNHGFCSLGTGMFPKLPLLQSFKIPSLSGSDTP